jgi:uncharacterized protein involved in exopolysaccharide biosynthesis
MAPRNNHREEDDRSTQGEIDLRVLGRGMWRRKRWILLPTLLVAIAAILFVQLTAPYYRSSALVLIENREGGAPRAGGDAAAPLPDEQAVASQVQLIQSRDLVRTVVKDLNLSSDPEFAEDKESSLTKLLRLVGLAGARGDLPFNERVVDKVAGNLSVYPVVGTRVVGIEFAARDADLAAKIVNGFIDAYLAIQRDAKRESNRQASQYLGEEIGNLRDRVSLAEGRVETFRAEAGLLVGTNNTTVAAQQLGDTTIQLSTARTQQAEAQAKAEMIRSVMRQGRPAEALEIANSELVRALSQQRSQLAAQIASEGRTLLPQHPRMRELSAQMGGLDEQIRIEAANFARAFENDARTAGARVEALTKQLELLKKTASTANGQDVELRALEREARSQRDLLEQMLTRYREATARDNPEALLADARVISRGAAATEPYFPKKGPTVLLATLGAFVLALFAAAVAEIFGGGSVRRYDEVDVAPPVAVAVAQRPDPIPPAPASPHEPERTPSAPEHETERSISPAAALATGLATAAVLKPSEASTETPAAEHQPVAEVSTPEKAPEPIEVAEATAETEREAAVEEPTETTISPSTPVSEAEAASDDSSEPVGAASEPVADAPALADETSAPAADVEAPVVAAAAAVAAASSASREIDHPADMECADATLVSALARQLASMPSGPGALRIVMTGAAEGLETRGVASELASTISSFGRRVIAVDVGGGVGHDAKPGLAELLTGEATFAQAIHRDPGSRVHLVPRGGQGFASLDVSAQGRLGVVLEALALTYDFVILTAPSGAGRADLFASHCGAAVLISNAGASDFVTVDAHERLRGAGIEDVVVLLVNNGGGSPNDKSLAA